MFGTHPELALFIIRLMLGSTFILHGSQKVFGLFGGPGLAGFAGWLATLGIPAWLAYLGAILELTGGISVIFGIATQLGAFFLACDMIVAIYLVHLSHGYFIQNNGFEYPFNLILICIALILGGPGKYYLWNPF